MYFFVCLFVCFNFLYIFFPIQRSLTYFLLFCSGIFYSKRFLLLSVSQSSNFSLISFLGERSQPSLPSFRFTCSSRFHFILFSLPFLQHLLIIFYRTSIIFSIYDFFFIFLLSHFSHFLFFSLPYFTSFYLLLFLFHCACFPSIPFIFLPLFFSVSSFLLSSHFLSLRIPHSPPPFLPPPPPSLLPTLSEEQQPAYHVYFSKLIRLHE